MKALRMLVTRIQSDHSESNQTTRSPIRPLRIQSDHSESNQTTQNPIKLGIHTWLLTGSEDEGE